VTRKAIGTQARDDQHADLSDVISRLEARKRENEKGVVGAERKLASVPVARAQQWH
jgi:hypothetical protein